MDNNYAPDLRPPPSDDVIAAPISKRGKERVYFTLSKWPPTYTTSQGAFSLRSTNVSRPRTTSEPAAGRASIRCKPFTSREKEKWLLGSIDRGFIRLYDPDAQLASSLVVPCSLETTCLQIASRLSVDPDDLHVQFNGDMLKRLLLDDRPLAIQNKFLASIGIRNVDRQQAIGDDVDLGHMIRFYAGHKNSEEPEVISLSKGKAKLAISNARGRCLKLASDPTRGAPIYFSLSFETAVRSNLIILSKLNFQLYFHMEMFHLFRLNLINGTTDASNQIYLDISKVLNCERCSIMVLRLNGNCLTEVNASKNKLRTFTINPPPENLVKLDLSHNCIESLPEWMSYLTRLERVVCSHNYISSLPSRLFTNASSLQYLDLSHNRIQNLPTSIENCALEVLLLYHNDIPALPDELLSSMHRLRVLNLSQNRLVALPAPSALSELNRIQQLYLACNRLTDASLTVIARYRRLQVLDISHNRFTWLPNDVIEKLQTLQELNISGNQINILPSSLVSLPFLVTLRAHSNQICEIPNFALSNRLTLIDLALNQLNGDQTRHMIAPRLKHIDIACNEGVANDDLKQLKILFPEKSISLVDVNNEWILPNEPWKFGFSESNETGAHKSCVVQVKDRLRDNDDMGVLLGIVDSLDSFEIADTLQRIIPEQVKAERAMGSTGDQYLKYALIMSHKALKEKGQRQGASCALCHLTVKRKNSNGEKEYDVRVANCGDTEIVLCRKGEPIMLTKKFLIENSDEEYARVRLAGGTVDENNRINGYTPCSRLTGCSFLYPSVIPIPHEYVWKLADCDEFLIIANRGVWQTINYNEAVARVRRTPEPAVAAKYLQDVVQAYGYTGDVSIIVVRFNFAKTGPDAGHIFSAIPYKEKYHLSTNNVQEVSTGDNLPDDSLVKSSRYFERDDCFQLKKELPEPSSTCEEDHSVTTTFHKEEPAYGVVPVPSKPTINLFSAKVVYAESATASSCSSSKLDQSNAAKPELHCKEATEHISDLELQRQRGMAKCLAINACQARQSLRSVTKEAWLSRHNDNFKKPQQPETLLNDNPNPLLTSSKRKDLLKFSSTNESTTTDKEKSVLSSSSFGQRKNFQFPSSSASRHISSGLYSKYKIFENT
ncbi:PH domain leucine-rich repeat protein phosphatase [Trichinella spiralis]|uniref:PH domain leucine-rich repeat protein phosphatase n=1 Tax=Trichinella spiralis TaxID=6334 RepID=UPI0001EFC689|nr:PH domain leucine-rich repeat protein phosphatase [Trichinella spiralis]